MRKSHSSLPAEISPAIQNMVVQAASDYQFEQTFHIDNLRLNIAIQHNKPLSYKQTRDALYRMRQKVAITHEGCGWYRWEF